MGDAFVSHILRKASFLCCELCFQVSVSGTLNKLFIRSHETFFFFFPTASVVFFLLTSVPSAEVEHFSPSRVSERVLFHLLRHPSVNQEVHFDPGNRLSPEHYLYTRNHPVDYFILLLQVAPFVFDVRQSFP